MKSYEKHGQPEQEKISQSDISNQIEGKNPVEEAVRSGLPIDKLFIADKRKDSSIQKIIDLAKADGIPYVFVEKNKLDSMSLTGHHQGIIAKTSMAVYADIEDIFEKAQKKNEEPFVFVLDGIEDPHNLGAIIRTAQECGAHGVIISKRRSCGITPVVLKASAGACSHISIVRVANISQTIDKLKERGIWFACADMGGELMYKQDLTGAIGLVIGNEGSGVSDLVKKKCDFICSIPMFGEVGSLNASVAAGVLAYEVVRRRHFAKAK